VLNKSDLDLYKEDIIDFAKRLIQTPSNTGNESHIAEVIVAELKKLNYDKIFIDDIGNIVGIMEGKENGVNIVNLSHMDHNLPTDFELWKYNPYSGYIENNILYGIGASDCKGSITAQIYAGALLKNNINKGNYIVSFTVGEGYSTCFGTKFLFDKTLKELNLNINLVIMGNATSLNIYLGQRGKAEFEIEIFGRTNASIFPSLGINAVHKIPPIIKGIENLMDNLNSDPIFEQSTIAITNVRTLPKSTSMIPDRCFITIDRRFFPSETLTEVKQQIQSILDKISIDDNTFKANLYIVKQECVSYTNYKEKLDKVMYPFYTDEKNSFIQSVYKTLKEINSETTFGTWYFNTDGGYPSYVHKIPTIGYGPGEEKFFATAFDQVKIENIFSACLGYASIFNNLNFSQSSLLSTKI
jgi:putative selenium metabolism hydrolase